MKPTIGGHVFDTRSLEQNVLDLPRNFIGLLKGRSSRKLDDSKKIALVFFGNESGRHLRANPPAREAKEQDKSEADKYFANQ